MFKMFKKCNNFINVLHTKTDVLIVEKSIKKIFFTRMRYIYFRKLLWEYIIFTQIRYFIEISNQKISCWLAAAGTLLRLVTLVSQKISKSMHWWVSILILISCTLIAALNFWNYQ